MAAQTVRNLLTRAGGWQHRVGRHLLAGWVLALGAAMTPGAALGQRVGDQIWIDLEAERVEDDGYAEGLVISLRPSLVEVQPSRVQMARPSDLANLLRRGNAFVPAVQVSPLEVGRRNWDAKQAVLAFQHRSAAQAFVPASPELQALLRTASEPRHRDRMRSAREMLTFLNAMVEPRGADAGLAGDLLRFANEGWTAFGDGVFGNADAFDRAAPAFARRATEAVRQLGGYAVLDPDGRMSDMLRQGGWARQHGAHRDLPPVPQRVLHLIERTFSARFDVVAMGAPDRVVEAIRTLPGLMATLETLHPDAILTPNAPTGREAMRQAFLSTMRDDIAAAYKERINDEEEVRRLRNRYLEGDEAALALWTRSATELTRQVAAALGRPLFDETDRNTLMEMRRALVAEQERRQALEAAARARLEAEQQAAEQRRAAIAALGSQVRDDWHGNVTCGQALIPLRFEIAQPSADGRITASVSFVVPNGVSVATMRGLLEPGARRMRLEFVQWIRNVAFDERPGPVELTLSENGQLVSGNWITSNCRPFQLQRAEALSQWLSRTLPAVWRGSFTCGGTEFAQSLEFKAPISSQALNATLTYGPETRRGIIELRGTIGIGGRITLELTRWVRRPQDDSLDGMELDVSAEGPVLNGRLLPRTESCQAFVLRRG